MASETRARRAVTAYLGLCVVATLPLVVVRSEAAASWLVIISLLALPWTRVAGAIVDRFGLAQWSLVPILLIGVAINASVLYWILGGRFRRPDK